MLFLVEVLQGENLAKKFKKLIQKRRQLKKTELFVPFDRYAFPLAHSAALFCITAYMLSQNMWVGTVALGLTILIVIARVESRVHDYIDIAGGFIIGVCVMQYLTPPPLLYLLQHILYQHYFYKVSL